MNHKKHAEDILRRADGLKVLKVGSVGYMVALSAVEDALAAAPAPAVVQAEVSEWISIADRLPELHQAVALMNYGTWMNTGGDFEVNWYAAGWLVDIGYAKSWSVIGETRLMTLESVTHWMPLPAAPKVSP